MVLVASVWRELIFRLIRLRAPMQANNEEGFVILKWWEQPSITLEICQNFYTTIFFDHKLYWLKMLTSGLFLLTINQRKCINISIWSFFVLKFIWRCKISTVTEEYHTMCLWNYKIYRCILYFSVKYAKKCVVFLKTLHSWQEFYTTAGRDGHDKFQVWWKVTRTL